MARQIQPAHFPPLTDLGTTEDSEERVQCIFPISSAGFRRCKNKTGKEDTLLLMQLRDRVRDHKYSSSTEQVLRDFALLYCCQQAGHRNKLEGADYLAPLLHRWQDELAIGRESSADDSKEGLMDDTLMPGAYPADEPQLLIPKPSAKIETESRGNASYLNSTSSTTEPEDNSCHNLRSRIVPKETPSSLDAETDINSSRFRPHLTNPNQTVVSVLKRRLKRIDSKSGSIYMYTRESDVGFVKIGYTTSRVSDRLRQWQRTCHYVPQLVFSMDDIPHIHRVESVLHHALAEFWRSEKKCTHNSACPRQHKEWFEVDVEKARQVIIDWVEWFRLATPYGADGQLRSEWHLAFSQMNKSEQKTTTCQKLLALRQIMAETADQANSTKSVTERPEEAALTSNPTSAISHAVIDSFVILQSILTMDIQQRQTLAAEIAKSLNPISAQPSTPFAPSITSTFTTSNLNPSRRALTFSPVLTQISLASECDQSGILSSTPTTSLLPIAAR